MRKPLIFALAGVCGLMLAVSSARAQSYSIDWFKIAGGGGTSSNGQYSVTGTIGQHDAGAQMFGGQYSLTGGFWSLISITQTPGSPPLSIRFLTPRSVVISWPSPSTGFLLQQNTSLATTNWSNFTGSINDDGTNKSIAVTSTTGNLFFRLKQ